METEGSSSGARSMRPWHEDQFIDLVLSWSTRDILDQNLYKNQVDEIPMSFESVDKYLGSYVYPLLEETRAHLASAMETVYRAPFAEIKSFTQSAYDTLHYNVNVDCWENRQGDGGREAYIRTLPGDIVMVSKTKPETASDLERAGWNYTLACVVNIPDDEGGEGCNSCNFVIRTAELVEFEHGQNDTLYVVFLLNVTPYKRIWSALTMRRNLRIIEKIISTRGMDEGHCKLCPRKCNSKIQEKLEPSLSSKLNESQLESILVSLSKTECYHKSSVELIWGPPGTGKTTTLSILLYTLLRMNVRTLICAPTNVAITELASRVLALARSSFNTELATSFGSFPLGDMLIFGNKDRLEVGSDVEEILLDHRVQRLVECLTPFTGWRQRVDSMLDFLVYCVSHYQIFTDHEINKAKQSPQDDEDCQHSESMSLLEFAKDRFSHLAKPLRECMLTFLTHLPRSFLQEHNFQSIRQLMLHLCSMEMLLFENSRMTCNELENAFLGKELMVGSEPLVDGTSSLLFVRSQCLSILKSIRASLLEIGLPIDLSIGTEKSSTTELCFQKASLIFCTTSSSFKLHSIEMEPFRMLIIDEAAQVKESESVIPFQILNVKHAVLVGDECQLPATVMSPLSKEVGFGRSLFERLSLLGHSKHLLNVQYRMHPIISQFPNSNFYQNQILDAPYVQSRSYERSYLQGRIFGPYSFINIRDGQEELGDVGHSRRNMVEVAVAVKLVHKLFKGSLNDVVTFRQIGHVVMMLLGSGKPKHDLCKKFLEKLGSNSHWKPFIENLMESVSGLELYKSIILHKALLGDPKIDTGDDELISPNCLVYLVERLLITVPHPQGFFFTTKSSFTECLTWLQSDANPSSIFPIDSKFYAGDTFKFVAEMVHPSLDFPRLTIEWINMCHMDSRYYFPLLMLRLLLILCTLCLNSYIPVSEISKALDAPQIIQQLPREFREAFSRTGENNNSAARIAEACKIIGDPLVIVSYSGSRPKFVSPDAIFVNLKSCSCKNEVMNILYPETACNQSTTVEKHMTESVITRPPPGSDHAESHSENGKENMFIKLALMRDIFETLGLLNNTNDNYEKMESLVLVLLEKEVEVLKHIKFMITSKADMCELQNQMPSEEDKDVMWEVTNAFSQLMDTSDIDLKAQSKMMKEILTSVDGNSPQAEAFWTRLNRKWNASVAGEGNSEGSTAGGAECSQVKMKKMKKNKSNKGKGSRRGK